MGKVPVPVSQLGKQMVEHGRIRLGVKGNGRPTSIDTFRFTSHDEAAIRAIADVYGGDPKPWDEASARIRNQWEVRTPAKRLNVLVLPGGLSVGYEMWAAGGCMRRCDGEVCTMAGEFDDRQVPCLCHAAGELACKPKVRLNVMLPDVPFGGSWRLETSSEHALHEMIGMVGVIEQLQATNPGMVAGYVDLVQEHGKAWVKPRGGGKPERKEVHYTVPRLGVTSTPTEVMQGLASPQAPALEAGARAALPAAPQVELPVGEVIVGGMVDGDDFIVDAEIVESDDPLLDVYRLPNAPRERVELTEKQIDGLRSGTAKWSAATEGKVVKA